MIDMSILPDTISLRTHHLYVGESGEIIRSSGNLFQESHLQKVNLFAEVLFLESIVEHLKESWPEPDHFELEGIECELFGIKGFFDCKVFLERQSSGYAVICEISDQSLKYSVLEPLTRERNMALVRNEELKEAHSEIALRLEGLAAEKQTAEARLQVLQGEMDTLLYRYSHDLRSPITRLLGLLNVAEESAVSDSESLSFLRLARIALHDVSTLNDRICSVAHIRFYEPAPETVQLPDWLREVVNPFTSEGRYAHALRVVCPEGDLSCTIDSYLLRLILDELIGNAILFGGALETGMVLHAATSAHGITISVEDFGPGLPEAVKEKLFTMFNRGTHDRSCFGLGLYKASLAAGKAGYSLFCEKSSAGNTIMKVVIDA